MLIFFLARPGPCGFPPGILPIFSLDLFGTPILSSNWCRRLLALVLHGQFLVGKKFTSDLIKRAKRFVRDGCTAVFGAGRGEIARGCIFGEAVGRSFDPCGVGGFIAI